MALWQKLWLVFAVIWVVVAALNVGTILAFSEENEKIAAPVVFGVAVPAFVYFAAWCWQRWVKRKPG